MKLIEFARKYVRVKDSKGQIFPLSELQLKRLEEAEKSLTHGCDLAVPPEKLRRGKMLFRSKSGEEIFEKELWQEKANELDRKYNEELIERGVKALSCGQTVSMFNEDSSDFLASEIKERFIEQQLASQRRYLEKIVAIDGTAMETILYLKHPNAEPVFEKQN